MTAERILALVGELAFPEKRAAVARSLAEALGAEDLLLFLRDPEVDVLLPASGFSPTLPQATRWRAFLANCVVHGTASGRMASPNSDSELDACGYRVDEDGVLVVLGGRPDTERITELLPVFRVVIALSSREGEVRALEAAAQLSAASAAQGRMLSDALDRSREQIRDALSTAREAQLVVDARTQQLMSADEELSQSREELEVMNEELIEANAALEATATDAERARASAEEANRAKAGFLAMMSHELRTPLNAIGGYTGLLEEGIMGPLAPGQREYLARIKRAQMHLLALINDVLNYAKSESGALAYDIVPLELRTVLAGVTPLIEPMAAARGVSYEYEDPPRDASVLGDRDKIVQIVLNLLTNAVKFTPPSGTVTLKVSVTPDQATVAVSDTGPGIREEQCSSIFEPFVQLERSFAGDREGVGLGLSISRELARGMKGDIAVDSVVGEGSTFKFSLPRPGRSGATHVEQPAKPAGKTD